MELRRHIRRAGALLATTAVACIAMMGGAFASTAFAATDDNIASGASEPISSHQSETCNWTLTEDGTLTVKPSNGTTGYIRWDYAPWSGYEAYIKHIKYEPGVIAGEGYNGFDLCGGSRLESIDLTNLDTSAVTNFDDMFNGCSRLTSIEGLEKLNTSSAKSFDSMFRDCTALKSVDISALNFDNVTTINNMFNGCNNIEKIALPKASTNKLKSMAFAFRNCSSIEKIDFTDLSTLGVTRIDGAFRGCSSLQQIVNLKSGELTSTDSIYLGCSSISNFENTCFTNLNTSRVSNFNSTFDGCSSLEKINITNKITLYATDLSRLARDCLSLKEIIGLDTVNMSNVATLTEMFAGCRSLASIDLSNFDINTTEDKASSLFRGCSNLATIFDDGGFVITPASGYWTMFDGCNKLVGGNGTSAGGWYWQTDESDDKALAHPSTSAEMARIDGGPNSTTPGYFTKKGEQPHVHQIASWSNKPKSCTESGYENGQKCETCETIINKGQYVYATGHRRTRDYSIENRIEATDTTNGSYDKVWKCSVCDEVLERQTVIIKSKAFLYPTHTLDGTVIPNNMLFKNLDKKQLTNTWTKEETLFYISQGICLMNETNPDEEATNWDRSYVSEESAAKIAHLCFVMFDEEPAWMLAYDNHYRCCSPQAYEERYEDSDNPRHYSDAHTDHYAERWHNNAVWACTLLDKYYSSVSISQPAALSVLTSEVGNYLESNNHLGNLLLKAFPKDATTAQLDAIGTSTLCNAISYPISYKELKTNAALYKAIGDYIIANASGADQIAVANKIMLERNASSGGSSGGSSSSGSSSSGGSVSSGGSSSGASSSEVNALKSEIASLKAELEKLKKGTANDETIAALQKTISSLEKNLDAMSSSLAQTQNALALSEMPRKISKSAMRAADSKVKIVLPTSASGAKVTFKPTSNKYLRVTKSGNVKVLKTLKKGKTYSIKVLATCGNQTKEITLKLKAK